MCRRGRKRPLSPSPPPPGPATPSPSHSLVLDKGVFVDGFNDVFEEDLGGQSVAVVHNGLPVRPIPAVHWRQTGLSGFRGPDHQCPETHSPWRPTGGGPLVPHLTPGETYPSPCQAEGRDRARRLQRAPRGHAALPQETSAHGQGPAPGAEGRAGSQSRVTHPPRSGSRPAGPRRTCPPSTGT